jgi:hypothetical protein
MELGKELLIDLLAAAIRISQLPAIPTEQMPPVIPVSRQYLVEKVCPEQPERCRSMAALFDTEAYEIYVRKPVDLRSPVTLSFIVHELVHVLQFREGGHARFEGCQAVLTNEQQAYKVQNIFLNENGSDWREGFSLRFMTCPPEPGKTQAPVNPAAYPDKNTPMPR